jgi:HAE1 family hydrophobic/amphiphilic exporter-1
MTLPELAIRRHVFAWILIIAFVLFGLMSFQRLGVSRLPDVDLPVLTIRMSYQNAAPEIMESEVVDTIESALMTVDGIRTVTSSSRRGGASITIEFELNKNIDIALQDVQAKLASVQRFLPNDMDPPTISKSNPEDEPILWLTLESETIARSDLMLYFRDELKDLFTKISGVGNVALFGYLEPNIRIWLSANQMSYYNLSPVDIVNTLSSGNIQAPAGLINQSQKSFNVRTMGELSSLRSFSNLLINQRGGQPNYLPIRLSQVASVEKGTEDITSFGRGMGKNAVGFGILKQRGANEVTVARHVKQKIAEIQKNLPPGMSLAVNMDKSAFTEDSVNDMIFTLILAAICTALVCWLFLGSVSSTLNILMTIPFSIIGAFIGIYFLGFTLNTFTLMALSLVIGIVVDDAIMVLENIIRHREAGEGLLKAALNGSMEISFAAIATTLAITAIFLPVAFMGGVIGKFFYQFGVTLAISVLLSLLGALTVTPMISSRFLKLSENQSRFRKAFDAVMDKTREFYRKILSAALKRRGQIVILAFLLFIISLFTLIFIPKEFTPAVDEGRFSITVRAPAGSSLNFTDGKIKEMEALLLKRPEIQRIFTFGGGSDLSSGRIVVLLKKRGGRGINNETHREWTQKDAMDAYRKMFGNIKGVRATIQDLSAQIIPGAGGFPVEFVIQGPDWNTLISNFNQTTNLMAKSGKFQDISTDYREGSPEVGIVPNRLKANARGVNISAIAQTVNIMIGSVVAGSYFENGHRYDIRIKLRDPETDIRKLVNKISVRNMFGELIPLSSVADLAENPQLVSISRFNRQRAIKIQANSVSGFSQDNALKLAVKIADETLPKGYFTTFSGSAQSFNDSFGSLIFALILGVCVAYMVLAIQFNSFLDPLSILMALPFSATGAFIALLIAGKSLNIYSMIGLILLMGIVKKNSIMLVDFTDNVRRNEKADVTKALLKACPIRLRPILMTSLAILAGALPAALAFGPGAESRVPMAVTVIGGVIVSTILTLFVVPCVYSLLSPFEGKHSHEAAIKELE